MKFRFKYLVAGTLACLTAASPAVNTTTWGMQADESTLQSLLRSGQPHVGLKPLLPPATPHLAGSVSPVNFMSPSSDDDTVGSNPLLPRVVPENSAPLVPALAAPANPAPLPAPIVSVPVPPRASNQSPGRANDPVPIVSGPLHGRLQPNVPIITSPLAPNITRTVLGPASTLQPTATAGQETFKVVATKPLAPAFMPPTIAATPAESITPISSNTTALTSLEANRSVAESQAQSARSQVAEVRSTPATPNDDDIQVEEISSESIAELMQAFGISTAVPASQVSTGDMDAKNRVAAIGSGANSHLNQFATEGMAVEQAEGYPVHYDPSGLNLGYERPMMPDHLPYDGYGTVSGASGYIFTDFLYMQRGDGNFSASIAPQLDGYDFSPGVRLTMGNRWDSIEGYEIGVTLMETQTSHTSVASPSNSLFTWLQPRNGFNAASLSSFNNASFHHSFHKGHYYSAEFNRVNWNWDVMSVFYGIRYTGIDELYALHSVGGGGDLGAYRLRARNHMIGPQLGGTMHYDIGRKLSFSLAAKIAGYANFYQTDTEFGNNNLRILDRQDSRANLAWGAEMGFFTHYSLTPRARIKGGWELWFYDRMATSQGQMDGFISPFSGTVAQNRDDVLFYGFSLGLEWFR